MPRPLVVPVTSTRLTSANWLDVELLADGDAFDGTAEFADEPLRLAAGLGSELDAGLGPRLGALAVELGNMTTFTAAGQAAGLVEKAELHRLVSVALFGAQLQHVAGPASITVTGTTLPLSSKICVIPTLRPSNPIAIAVIPVVCCRRERERDSSHAPRLYPRSFQCIG